MTTATPRRSVLDVLDEGWYDSAMLSINLTVMGTILNVKPLAADDPRHGTYNGYNNLKCRCTDCRRANAVRQVDYLNRHPEQREKRRVWQREWRRQRRLKKAGSTR